MKFIFCIMVAIALGGCASTSKYMEGRTTRGIIGDQMLGVSTERSIGFLPEEKRKRVLEEVDRAGYYLIHVSFLMSESERRGDGNFWRGLAIAPKGLVLNWWDIVDIYFPPGFKITREGPELPQFPRVVRLICHGFDNACEGDAERGKKLWRLLPKRSELKSD